MGCSGPQHVANEIGRLIPLIVVDNPKAWPLRIPGATVVSARAYLTKPYYSDLRQARIFNLCRSYRYQSMGYYVSLLAQARGHKPLPSITTIQDLKSVSIVRVVSDDLEDLIQRSLHKVQSKKFTLSVYFGRNLARRHQELSAHLFRLFQTPLLRAEFVNDEEDGWKLQNVRPMEADDIPEAHHPFVIESALEFFAQKRTIRRPRNTTLFDLAILRDADEETPPSDERALKRFEKAGRRIRFGVEFIDKEDFGRIAEFDALFIRETTAVNHHTYRFARRAVAEGLVSIDDPESITRCGNKVYLAELLDRHNIPHPRTLIVHKDNRDKIAAEVGLPCVLKQPDGSFSRGVRKASDAAELKDAVDELLDSSDLIIAQEFVPTDYDWRIGVLDNQPIFACRYHMCRDHWQIRRESSRGRVHFGRVETLQLNEAPANVVRTAVRAARLVGDGLYGVDLKQLGRQVKVIEINDNPNVDAGYEDRVAGDDLYDRFMRVFLNRILRHKNGREVSRV
jgi:glutathione synthase/RimK-type ligase-like ATP-grasp enzyme